MVEPYRVVALTEKQAVEALPLVRAAWPHVTPEAWQSFVHTRGALWPAEFSGLLAARDRAGTICGLLAHRAGHDLHEGLVLILELFAAAALAGVEDIVQELLRAAESKALELGCSSIQIKLHATQASMQRHLIAIGLDDIASILSKKVAGPAALH